MPNDAIVTQNERPISVRFTEKIIAEFKGIMGEEVELSQEQRKLAKNLFTKMDSTFAEMEIKRNNSTNKLPITWQNMDLAKLALSAVHRIDIGLDAMVPGQVYPIPYKNNKTGKYDVDLRIGHKGMDYYIRKYALDPPLQIVYKLVRQTDIFKKIERGINSPIDTVHHEVVNPWKPGAVVGGYGMVIYADQRKNFVVMVTPADFEKSRSMAKTQDFWTKNPDEMKLKTIMHRVLSKIAIDSSKTNVTLEQIMEEGDNFAVLEHQDRMVASANSEELLPPATVTEGEPIEVIEPDEAEAPWLGICPLHEVDLLPAQPGRDYMRTGFYCPEKMPGYDAKTKRLTMDKLVGCRCSGKDENGELMSIDRICNYRDAMGKGTPENDLLAEALGYVVLKDLRDEVPAMVEAAQSGGRVVYSPELAEKLPFEEEHPHNASDVEDELEAMDPESRAITDPDDPENW